jgi:hypothetical protein
VHDELEALLRPDGNGGRPRQLGVDVFLAGLLCTVAEKTTLALGLLHELLTRDLARSYQVALGIRKGTRAITVRQVRYLPEAIESKLAFTEGRAPELSAADREERAAALQAVFDHLLAATMPAQLRPTGAYALDDSGIDSAARGKRRPKAPGVPALAAMASDDDGRPSEVELNGREVTDEVLAKVTEETGYSFDVDASWGYRTRTYDNRTNKVFGYKLVSLTRLAPQDSKADLPLLVERISLVPANASTVAPALGLIDGLLVSGTPVTELADDRGFSYALPEHWADELRARHIEQICDLHRNDHGVHDFEGVKMIDGWPHCPMTPRHLEVISRPAQLSVPKLKQNATPAERAEHAEKVREVEEFRAAIAERKTWAFRRTRGADANGTERFECPAQAGMRVCANCPVSQFLPPGTPKVENPPERATAPKACRQRTIGIPGDVTPKIRQRHYWGSDAWIAAYVRRSRVEGAFGNIKRSKTENVRRGWTHVVGLVKTGLMAVIAQAAANLRCLRAWAARTGDRTDSLTHLDPEDYGFEEIDQATAPPASTGPPAAA